MGKITNIQRFCIDDGPGIRTTVFLSGCPLKCLWCHNPETWSLNGTMFYYPDKCVSCGKCTNICKNHVIENGRHVFKRENCNACGKCLQTGCDALEYSVKDYSSEKVIDIVKEDAAFYKSSGGGVTLSGGEPMMQFQFLLDLVKKLKKEDIHICLETSGYAPTEKFLEIKDYIDLFLYDYKITNEKEHIKYTGVSNELILHNLSVLDKNGALVVLRCPIIPTINDNEEHLLQIGKLADKYDSIKEINLMPYHTLGNSKRLHIGKETVLDNIENVSRVKIREYADRIITKKKIIC